MAENATNRLIDGAHKASMECYPSYRHRMAALAQTLGRPWRGDVCRAPAVEAVVDYGRWIARCECGGAEYVTPDDPVFYCCSCGNARTNGAARPVAFPEDIAEIEAALMEIPVDDSDGKDAAERALRAKPVLRGLVRNWKPGEKPAALRKKLKDAKAREKKDGGQ